MKKNLTYRDKLLELASIYKIADIKSYIKNKKYLTTAQIEHILKKNKVPIPTEINKSIIEIHSKKIKIPFFSAGNHLNDNYIKLKKNTLNLFFYIFKSIRKLILSIVDGLTNFANSISRGTVNLLNRSYNFKIQEKKGNKLVSTAVTFTFIIFITLAGFQVKDLFFEKNLIETKKIYKESRKEKRKRST